MFLLHIKISQHECKDEVLVIFIVFVIIVSLLFIFMLYLTKHSRSMSCLPWSYPEWDHPILLKALSLTDLNILSLVHFIDNNDLDPPGIPLITFYHQQTCTLMSKTLRFQRIRSAVLVTYFQVNSWRLSLDFKKKPSCTVTEVLHKPIMLTAEELLDYTFLIDHPR